VKAKDQKILLCRRCSRETTTVRRFRKNLHGIDRVKRRTLEKIGPICHRCMVHEARRRDREATLHEGVAIGFTTLGLHEGKEGPELVEDPDRKGSFIPVQVVQR